VATGMGAVVGWAGEDRPLLLLRAWDRDMMKFGIWLAGDLASSLVVLLILDGAYREVFDSAPDSLYSSYRLLKKSSRSWQLCDRPGAGMLFHHFSSAPCRTLYTSWYHRMRLNTRAPHSDADTLLSTHSCSLTEVDILPCLLKQ
jgi:hypothetical protein